MIHPHSARSHPVMKYLLYGGNQKQQLPMTVTQQIIPFYKANYQYEYNRSP